MGKTKDSRNGFKKYTASAHEYATGLYQKIVKYKDNDIAINIYEYTHYVTREKYEVKIQLGPALNELCMYINILIMEYSVLDFERMEHDAMIIIKRLVK